jgi:predicted Zn finger-like uncharacterized protein
MVSNSLTDRLLGSSGRQCAADSPMLIVCPSCGTSYDVDMASLSPNGRQVRCLRCRAVWRAEPSQADKLVLAAAAIAPGADDGADAAEETIARSVDWAASDGVPSVQSPALRPDASPALDFSDDDAAAADVATGDSHSAVDAPPIVPVDLDEGRSDINGDRSDEPPPQAEDIESVAARRQQRRNTGVSLRWPLSLWQTAILALALADTILIGWREDVVRALPQTASFYSLLQLPVNLRNLSFNDVTTSMEQHEGVPILVVEGNVFNAARKSEDVPRLKFIVRNAARQEIYSWTAVPSRGSLAPGETVSFRTRLASPPANAHDVVLRFVNRRDIVGGGR